MRKRGLHLRVMLCWRGLGTTHIHRLSTTYISIAKIQFFLYSSKLVVFFIEEKLGLPLQSPPVTADLQSAVIEYQGL